MASRRDFSDRWRYPYGDWRFERSRYRYYPYWWGFGTGYPYRTYWWGGWAWRPYVWYPWYARWYVGCWYPYWGVSWSIVLGYPYTWVEYYDPWWYWYYPSRTIYVSYPYVEYRYYPYYVSADASVESSVDLGEPSRSFRPEAIEERVVPEKPAEQKPPESVPKAELHPLRLERPVEESLGPAQREFVAGLYHFRFGEFEAAADAFYNATLEDPASRVPKLFLGFSLVSAGEYRFAAEYIRLALDGWQVFPALAWDLRTVYSDPAQFESDLRFLEGAAALDPADADALFLVGFYKFHSGQAAEAGRSFEALVSVSDDPLDREIARSYQAEIERRTGAEAVAGTTGRVIPVALEEEDVAVQNFLASLSPESALELPIR